MRDHESHADVMDLDRNYDLQPNRLLQAIPRVYFAAY